MPSKVVPIVFTGAMDSFARGLKKASQIITEGVLAKNVKVGSMFYVVSKWFGGFKLFGCQLT